MAQLENVRISIIDEDSIEKAIEKTKEREGEGSSGSTTGIR
ncbi:unnamed protein product [marine sediment metagenome]|uniref:Uncharacterized protein n=1 Tax=marine sediment metagenome TaxID=412755 RepID=X1NC99_9ZZZZ